MKYLSLFSGIGGFELGIQQAYANKTNKESPQQIPDTLTIRNLRMSPYELGSNSPTCIGYSEIDKYATQIYQKHFPNHKNYGDITKINPAHLPDFDALFAGFPCQSFSIAGKRRGFADTRGTMFFEIARILKEKQPRLFLLENVKGLLSHDNGSTFRTIITTLDELGYDMEWQVLNSKNFGVPQNRERVFIVGHLRGTSRPEVFPIGQNDSSFNKQLDEKLQKGEIASTVTATYWKGGKGSQIQNGIRIRRLTPTECERLQGFPDGWTEKGINEKSEEVLISDTQRYKTLGNAITTCVVKEIMIRLLKE